MWCIGTKLTDAWQRLTDEEQQANLDRIKGYQLAHTSPVLDDGEKAAHERLKQVKRGGVHAVA